MLHIDCQTNHQIKKFSFKILLLVCPCSSVVRIQYMYYILGKFQFPIRCNFRKIVTFVECCHIISHKDELIAKTCIFNQYSVRHFDSPRTPFWSPFWICAHWFCIHVHVNLATQWFVVAQTYFSLRQVWSVRVDSGNGKRTLRIEHRWLQFRGQIQDFK